MKRFLSPTNLSLLFDYPPQPLPQKERFQTPAPFHFDRGDRRANYHEKVSLVREFPPLSINLLIKGGRPPS